MRSRLVFAVVLVAAVGSALAQAPHMNHEEAALLYETYCGACHTKEIHWRDARLVKDWPGLVGQVRRWQANLNLGWSDEEIRQVAHYLNLRYYRFAPGAPKVIVDATRGAPQS